MVKMKINIFFLFIFFSSSWLSELDDQINIHLITTNDLHGFLNPQKANFMNPSYPPLIVGAAGMKSYLDQVRKEADTKNEGVLVLDGGNFFQGNPIGMVDSGKTMVEWFEIMKYDAVVPGHYDFVFGKDNYFKLSEKFKHVNVVASNLISHHSFNAKPYIVKEVEGVKIAILGIANSNLNNLLMNSIKINTEHQAISRWLPKIKRDENPDVIIILSSSGIPYDREEKYQLFLNNIESKKKSNLTALELGYFSNGVDVIVSGGVSKGYPKPWYDPNSHVYIFQNYGGGTSFGHVVLNIDRATKKFKGYSSATSNSVSQTLLSDDFIPDSDMLDWITSRYSEVIEKKYSSVDYSKSISPIITSNIQSTTNTWDVPNLGNDDDIEVLSWNCEFFPIAGDSTIESLSEIVVDLDLDIIAFQEIKYLGWFEKLMSYLPEYAYVVSQNSSFFDQAIIYKYSKFNLINQIEPFSENDYNFAGRPPLRADFTYADDSEKKLSIINIHMKCCDSGLLRRKRASAMLHEYVSRENYDQDHLMLIVGDWNDDLRDAEGEHCFTPFLDDHRYKFATLDIVNDISQLTYPKAPYQSFLDHILFSSSSISDYKVETVLIDKYMGGYDIYQSFISDHRPVMLSFSKK